MWRQGFTKTKRLKESDNIAAYLMAYLTDMPKNEIISNAKDKSIMKGARLHFYPSGVHIYRSSRGIKKPTNFKGFKGQVLKDLGLSEDVKADATFNRKHKIKSGKQLIHITEFYDNISHKKKTNQARQDND